jgi:hypothetical protein
VQQCSLTAEGFAETLPLAFSFLAASGGGDPGLGFSASE